MYISSVDIDDKVEAIGKMWNSVKSIPKLKSYHHFKYLKDKNFILSAKTAKSDYTKIHL